MSENLGTLSLADAVHGHCLGAMQSPLPDNKLLDGEMPNSGLRQRILYVTTPHDITAPTVEVRGYGRSS